MAGQSTHYAEKYGAWAGFPKGHSPNFTRCCEKVFGDRTSPPGGYQCLRPRGHGPDGAYCKQHDPAAVKARQAASTAKYNAQMNQERYGWHGRSFYNVLVQIAEGHNDARGLAQEAIDEFKKGER